MCHIDAKIIEKKLGRQSISDCFRVDRKDQSALESNGGVIA
jgi:hypothetical protein